jgi:hypothetical protein
MILNLRSIARAAACRVIRARVASCARPAGGVCDGWSVVEQLVGGPRAARAQVRGLIVPGRARGCSRSPARGVPATRVKWVVGSTEK